MSACTASALKAQLKKTREEKLKEAGHVQSDAYEPAFFPYDAIDKVLRWDNVNLVLACPCDRCVKLASFASQRTGSKERTSYAEFVMEDAPRLFALLVYVNLSALISAFEPKGDIILDDELDMESLKIYLPETNRPTGFGNDLEAFLNHQHEFSPALFDGSWYEKWGSRKALPFINTRLVGKGGYGTVYSFEIYPGYEKLPGTAPAGIRIPRGIQSSVTLTEDHVKRKFAMKEVALTSMSILENPEAETLTKIRAEFSNEKHIIKVLQIFTRGEKLHLIFPLAKGNLKTFMTNPWNHLPIADKPICTNTIWDEVVGVLKALANFHKPQENSKWRGYHADIKPTNILVFDDGRLVIADFGLATITRKTGSGTTRRPPQQPGEQAYRPPENSAQADMGHEYDDWAMGCVILEILVFAAKGSEGVQQFRDARQKQEYLSDYFYYDVRGVRSLHPEALKVLEAFEANSGFTKDVSKVVRAMLEIDPKQRINSDKASKDLQQSLTYWREQASRRQTGGGNVPFGPNLPDEQSSPSDQNPRLQRSGSPISRCPTIIEDPLGDRKTICELASEVQWSSDSYNYHQELLSFAASIPGRQLSIRPGHGQNSRFKAFPIPANLPVVPTYAFMLQQGEGEQRYEIQIDKYSFVLYSKHDAYQLQQFLTEQKVHLSSRATVTTKWRGLFGQSSSVLSLCLVQLWTEVGDEDHNREEWGTQQNAPPQFTSRLVIFVTEAKSSFISIPLIDGNNRLIWERDVKQRSMTFRRVGNASIKGYRFAQTVDGILPGIPLNREKLQSLEKLQMQEKKCEKFSSIQLKFIGEKSLPDFKEFRDCYHKLETSRA